MRKECRTTVDEFTELGHGFDKMRVDELSDPLRRLLTVLRLEFDLKYAIPIDARLLSYGTS